MVPVPHRHALPFLRAFGAEGAFVQGFMFCFRTVDELMTIPKLKRVIDLAFDVLFI